MGYSPATIQKSENGSFPIRRLVHGLRNWSHIHVPVLALAGLRRLTDSLWSSFGYQPRFGDIRLFLQFPTDTTNGARKSAVSWPSWEYAQVSVHFVVVQSMVGIAV